MPDSPRIEELRRRVQLDPASIAFAALAEEYRRAGRFDEAIETCKAGLVRHPSYLSAHVTLGRAFIEIGRLQDARAELEYVLKLAPENLAAIRGLAEIHDRVGDESRDAHTSAAVAAAAPAPAVALEGPSETLPASAAAGGTAVARSDPPAQPLNAPASVIPLSKPAADVALTAVKELPDTPPHVVYPSPEDPALAGLEEFLYAIMRARSERTAAR